MPLHSFMAGQRGSLGRNVPYAESPTMAPPGPQAASEPTSSLRSGECPPRLLPLDAHMAGWRHGPLFPGCPCQRHCPRGHWRYGSRFKRAHTCPLRYPGPSWALGLPRPTSPVPGVPTKRCDTMRSHAPSPSTGLLHPSKRVSGLHSHQQQKDLHFVNLANPLTDFTLTPGSLGWESLLRPITHRTMHTTFTPFTQARWPSLIQHVSIQYSSHIAEHCHSSY